jgi:hypothetical protein
VERDFAGDPLVDKVIAFIRRKGLRPLMMPSNSTIAAGSAAEAGSAADGSP